MSTEPYRGPPLRVAALVKQIPRVEEMAMTDGGRLLREGVPLEMNAYCRRAVAMGVTIAAATQGSCAVCTLGPPSAEDVLREAIACGATRGVLISDPAFAGSDTLATAKALGAAIERLGPFDLILCGRNSLDADTGQVGPELAQLLGLPFLCGIREIAIASGNVDARCEHDDGWLRARTHLPLLGAVAERACAPCKAPPEARAAVPAELIRHLCAADLGPGPWGVDASATRVGRTRSLVVRRAGTILTGPLVEQVTAAHRHLGETGALAGEQPEPTERVADSSGTRRACMVAVLVEPERERVTRELCGAAARIAVALEGCVTALTPDPPALEDLGAWGADRVVEITHAATQEAFAHTVIEWARQATPRVVLAPGTVWGRETAARIAAGIDAGLTGDAVALDIEGGQLVAWKPAFGGSLVAAITATSPSSLVTVRPGALALRRPRSSAPAPLSRIPAIAEDRIEILDRTREDDLALLANARCVIGLGMGVAPADYPKIAPLRHILGAELAATRKVTDRGWMARARQVGITGQSLSPRLYIAIGASGKFNHSVGLRGARCVLAINNDSQAPIFSFADIGIVADWREAVPLLSRLLACARPPFTLPNPG